MPDTKIDVTYAVVGGSSFTFPAPTPYVSRDHENIDYGGDIWGAGTNITLNGQIYLYNNQNLSDNARFQELNAKKDAIIDAFSSDFGTLTVDGADIGTGCILQSINFSDNGYGGIVDYTITLKAYELSSFKTNNKVLEPVDRFSFTEGGDGFIALTHTISAKGFNTNGGATDAFSNAKTFVDSRKGLGNKPTTTLIGNTGALPVLVSVSESVDRFSATYSVTENYRYHSDPNFNGDFLTKYTISKVKSVDNGITTVSIQGEIKSKKHNYSTINSSNVDPGDSVTMDYLMDEFEDTNWREVCENESGLTAESLNDDPVTLSTNQDERARLLTFNISFDNDTLYQDAADLGFGNNGAYYDFSLSVDTDEMNSITTVGLSGLIKSRGTLEGRNANVKSLLDGLIASNYGVLKTEAQDFSQRITGNENFTLTNLPHSVSINKNIFNGTISLSIQFTDKNFYPSYDIVDSDYQIAVTPAMNQYSSRASCNKVGSYIIYDVNANSREIVGISVNGKLMNFSSTDISTAKKEFNLIMNKFRNEYVDGSVRRLDSEGFVEGKQDHSINMNSEFSCRKDASFLTIDRKKPDQNNGR
jgi:hypothetical protein